MSTGPACPSADSPHISEVKPRLAKSCLKAVFALGMWDKWQTHVQPSRLVLTRLSQEETEDGQLFGLIQDFSLQTRKVGSFCSVDSPD